MKTNTLKLVIHIIILFCHRSMYHLGAEDIQPRKSHLKSVQRGGTCYLAKKHLHRFPKVPPSFYEQILSDAS